MNTQTNHPVRVLDTRSGSGRQGAGEMLGRDFNFYPGTGTSPYGTPAVSVDATAMAPNVTAASSTAPLLPDRVGDGGSQPLASNLNFIAGKVVPNRVIVPINPVTKQASIYNFAGATDVVVDLDGYYSPDRGGSLYYPLVTPTRIVNTRPGSRMALSPVSPSPTPRVTTAT